MYPKIHDMSKSQNFVRRMAEHFEQISLDTKTYGNGHEINFKQCNWWLETPSSVHYFDDPMSEPNPQQGDATANCQIIYENVSEVDLEEITGRRMNKDCDDGAIDSAFPDLSAHNEPDGSNFLLKVDQCLRFAHRNQTITESKSDTLNESNRTIEINENAELQVAERKESENVPFHKGQPMSLNVDLAQHRPTSSTSNNSQASNFSDTLNDWTSARSSYTSHDSGSTGSSNQITNTVEELIFNEETYIKALNQGIEGYMKNFDRKNMPADLRGQKNRVFGNVVQIKYFHENVFYPALKQCDMDIIKICKTFCEFIEKDCFYIYILYAINRQKSEKICEVHRNYFKELQSEIGDKLGVNSFLVQPIQRLPKYKLLLGQLFSELGKRFELHDDRIKNEIAACCLAEKQLQRLLDTVNGSMNVNDIVDCNDLHILCQGKFILIDRFDICEKSDLRRRYKGKVFLFEKCIVYTEISGKHKLYYRGHFRQITLGFTFEDQRNCFRLYNERKGNQEVEFSAEPQTLQLWMKMLNTTMASVVLIEKKKIEGNRKASITSVFHDTTTLSTQFRNSDSSTSVFSKASRGSDDCTNSIADCSTMSDSVYDSISMRSNRSIDSQSTKNTTWYTEFDDERKLIERFLNSEKYFIQLLKNAVTTYLTNLPDEINKILVDYLASMKTIMAFHADTFFPKLQLCDMKAPAICDLIKFHVDASDFNSYFTYAAYVSDALSTVGNHFENCDTIQIMTNNHTASDLNQLLLMPISHIDNYAKFLENLLNEYKTRDLLTEDFKTVAAVEIEMKKMHKLISENFKLNSMKTPSTCIVRQLGLITYSEEIAIDFTKCRLMILEKGLVCVRTKISTKSRKEKFLEQMFSIPILNIELHENDAYPRKLKILVENASFVNYTITFATTRKKKQFMDAIRTQRNLPHYKH